jgi:hypothetical protein
VGRILQFEAQAEVGCAGKPGTVTIRADTFNYLRIKKLKLSGRNIEE